VSILEELKKVSQNLNDSNIKFFILKGAYLSDNNYYKI
jgi:hypothetical protein